MMQPGADRRPRFGAMLRQFRRAPPGVAGPDALVLYNAYGSDGRAVLEGRVIDHQIAHPPTLLDSRRANLRRNLRLLFNKERPHVAVSASLHAHHWRARTDAEGYFRIEMNGLEALAPGWHPIKAAAGAATATIPVLLAPPQNVYGVLSDFDDTLMITEVLRLRRMLANTFLRNPLQRQVVPGMPALFHRLAARNPLPAAAPIFYVSASPRQLHMPLQAVLDHHGFPPGVLITKRLTNDATREPLRDQLRYKMRRFEEILARVPHVTFTLIGDDGERDPEIFHELRARHPTRIADVWIRRVHPNPRPRPADQGDLADLLARVE